MELADRFVSALIGKSNHSCFGACDWGLSSGAFDSPMCYLKGVHKTIRGQVHYVCGCEGFPTAFVVVLYI